nr:hypothetical protein [Pirellula sp.]
LSGNSSPRESMPELVQNAMLLAPTTHFVMLAQAILFRGAGLSVIWSQLLALGLIGATFFIVASIQFRRSVTQMR